MLSSYAAGLRTFLWSCLSEDLCAAVQIMYAIHGVWDGHLHINRALQNLTTQISCPKTQTRSKLTRASTKISFSYWALFPFHDTIDSSPPSSLRYWGFLWQFLWTTMNSWRNKRNFYQILLLNSFRTGKKSRRYFLMGWKHKIVCFQSDSQCFKFKPDRPFCKWGYWSQ